MADANADLRARLGMTGKSDPRKDPELLPDAWSRFERAVDVVAKSPPQHRTKSKKATKKKKAPSKGERR
jgi:hypothetical protein